MPFLASLAQDYALRAATFRLIRGDASLTSLHAELLAAFGQETADAFAEIAPQLTSQTPSLIPQTGKTAIVSLLATGTHEIDMPIDSTRRILLIMTAFVEQTRTGTATGSLIYSIGTNSPNHNDIIASTTVGAAPFNATTFAAPFALNTYPTSAGMPTMGTRPSLRITTALTGATALTGRLGLAAWYV
jgi:hypothetical protein